MLYIGLEDAYKGFFPYKWKVNNEFRGSHFLIGKQVRHV